MARLSYDWRPVAGAVQYQLQVDNSAGFSSPEIDVSPAVSSYTPATGLAEDTYSWRVRATNGAGQWSAWSDPWTLTVKTTYYGYLPFIMVTP